MRSNITKIFQLTNNTMTINRREQEHEIALSCVVCHRGIGVVLSLWLYMSSQKQRVPYTHTHRMLK